MEGRSSTAELPPLNGRLRGLITLHEALNHIVARAESAVNMLSFVGTVRAREVSHPTHTTMNDNTVLPDR